LISLSDKQIPERLEPTSCRLDPSSSGIEMAVFMTDRIIGSPARQTRLSEVLVERRLGYRLEPGSKGIA
jgi:hypothetical protein